MALENNGNLTISEGIELKKILTKVLEHPDLSEYFTEDVTVFCEREIMTNNKEIIIPDRLNFIGDQVVIIDYKTGKRDEKYHDQINYYAKTLVELGYSVLKKYLVYIGDEIFVDDV